MKDDNYTHTESRMTLERDGETTVLCLRVDGELLAAIRLTRNQAINLATELLTASSGAGNGHLPKYEEIT